MSSQNQRKAQSVTNFRFKSEESLQEQININHEVMGKHFQSLLGKNKEYFQTIIKQYGQVRPKLLLSPDYKRAPETLYQQNYCQKQTRNIPIVNLNTLPQFKTSQPMKMETTNRMEIPNHARQQVIEPFIPKQLSSAHPFNADSTYNTRYVDWKLPGQEIVAGHYRTVLQNQHMITDTLYRDSYKGAQSGQDNFLIGAKSGQYKNPISPDLPFIADSWNQKTFQGFQSKFSQQRQKIKEVQSLPSFQGQFRSTQQSDFIHFCSLKTQQ